MLHLYLAEELTFGAPSPDEDEYLELVRTPLDELARRALSGELTDAKTVVGILKVHALRQRAAAENATQNAAENTAGNA